MGPFLNFFTNEFEFFKFCVPCSITMNYPAASSGVSKTTTGKTLRPKGRGIHPDGNKISHRNNLWRKDMFMPIQWSPTGKRVVPKNHTHLRQGFGGSSAGERNPPKHGRSVAERVPIRSYAFLHGQGRGLLRRRMRAIIFYLLSFSYLFICTVI